jgi:GT2 family glycosyltransferase
MKFSFVVITYNNKYLLKNTLEALNSQTSFQDDYEIIVVDDGSIDGSKDYTAGVNTKNNLEYYYLERNEGSGRARARNYGWKKALGEYIIFIDSDIIVKENYLSELDRYFSFDENILVIGNRLLLEQDPDNGNINKSGYYRPDYFNNLEYRYFIFQRFSYNISVLKYPWFFVYGCNIAIPRRWLERINGFDENFKGWGLEDLDFGYRAYREGIKIVVNSRMEVLHQFHCNEDVFRVEKNKIPGYRLNFEYFWSKFPGIFNLEKETAFKALTGGIFYHLLIRKTRVKSRKKIRFTSKKQLAKVKNKIEYFSGKQDYELIVLDFVEDTDLDIWIQLIKQDNILIKYYPASRIPDQRKLFKFLKEKGAPPVFLEGGDGL